MYLCWLVLCHGGTKSQDFMSHVFRCFCQVTCPWLPFFLWWWWGYIPMIKELVTKARSFDGKRNGSDSCHKRHCLYQTLRKLWKGLNLKPQSSNENKRLLLVLDHDQMGHMKESYIVGNKGFLLEGYKTACFLSCLLSSDVGRPPISHSILHLVLATF